MSSKINQYVIERKIEKGSFGKVELAYHEFLKMRVAIKIIDNVKIQLRRNKEQLYNEMLILQSFKHPNIIRLIETMRSVHKFYIVMEYAEGGDLFNYVQNKGALPEKEARDLFRQIVLAIEFCHLNGLSHRDIKLENVVLTANHTAKVIDFGLSKTFTNHEFLESGLGSLKYQDPDRLRGQPYSGEAADVWSLGVILFALLTGHRPFEGEIQSRILNSALSKAYTIKNELSAEARDLIDRILEPSAAKRITLPEIKVHPWFVHEDLLPMIDHLYAEEQTSKDRFDPTIILEPLLEKLLQLPFDWASIGSRDKIRQAIAESANIPFVNAYKMLYYDEYDRVSSVDPYHNNNFIFNQLSKSLSNPARYKRIMKVFVALNLEYSQASISKPWKVGFKLKQDVRVTLSRLSKLFNLLKIKIELQAKSHFKFGCFLIVDKRKSNLHFSIQFFSDAGMRLIQIKNENLPLFQFIGICKKMYLCLENL